MIFMNKARLRVKSKKREKFERLNNFNLSINKALCMAIYKHFTPSKYALAKFNNSKRFKIDISKTRTSLTISSPNFKRKTSY